MDSLLSNNITTLAKALKTAIQTDLDSDAKKNARIGVKYYKGQHDILENRIFYIDDNNEVVEDKHASNIRIPHEFFTEIVDQKVQYLLSNPLEYEVTTEDEKFQEYLKEYYDDEFQLFLQEMLEGSSQKGHEYAYIRTTEENKITFQVADSLGVFYVYDEDNNPIRLVRYYDKTIIKDNKEVNLRKAEIWTDTQVWFFEAENDGDYKLDPEHTVNPRPHILAKNEKGEMAGRSYEALPFHKLENNKYCRTDLEPIKALIDDYDLMNAFLSNNLQDFTDAIYVVKGFMGDDLSKLRQNIKAKKTIATGEGGDVDIKTIEIPVEGRKTKMELDKENIYKFGMAFDSSQIGDGNITNVVIKSRYALLDMKSNKAEARLKVLLKWANEKVVEDINRRNGTQYKPEDVEFTLVRETMVNEKDIAENAKTEAETKQIVVETIIAASTRLDDDSVLQQICEQFDLDWEEVKKKIEQQEFTTGLGDEDDEDTDDEENPIGDNPIEEAE